MEMENIQMMRWKEESSAAAVPIKPPILLLNALFGAGGGVSAEHENVKVPQIFNNS